MWAISWRLVVTRERLLPLVAFIGAVVWVTACVSSAPPELLDQHNRFDELTALPAPVLDGSQSLEEALAARRSVRTFSSSGLDDELLGQLLWAGQGITDSVGHRTAPSAGALYPIELYVVTADTVQHYLPEDHSLEWRSSERALAGLVEAAFGQAFVGEAPLVLVVAAVPKRTEAKYGAVAEALVDRESGHVAQNILLQATVLDLGATAVGGFDPAQVSKLLALPPGWDVRYLIPVGRRR